MNVIDVSILVSISALVVFFASVAISEWWDARAERKVTDQHMGAQVIQHQQSESKAA